MSTTHNFSDIDKFNEQFELLTQDNKEFFDQYVCCRGGIRGMTVECACEGLTWGEKLKDFFLTQLQASQQSLREERGKIVTLYMKALEGVELPEEVWKKLARVNQLVLDK